jgi:hypothetical protein
VRPTWAPGVHVRLHTTRLGAFIAASFDMSPLRRFISIVRVKQSERDAEQQLRVKRDDPEATEGAVVRYTRRLGWATWAIAGAGILTFFGALLQWEAMRQQLTEMQNAAIDTKNAVNATNRLAQAAENYATEAKRLADEAKRSADAAVDTERRELRAYLGVDNPELHCPLCLTTDPTKPIEIRPEDILSNMVILYLHNGGRTPAYNVNGRGVLWEIDFGQQLPKAFDFFDNSALNFTPGSATLNPGQRHPAHFIMGEEEILRIARAHAHKATVFFYGHISYADVFGAQLSTPFCFQYLPDHPDDSFSNCPEHNTPEQGR